MDIYKYLFGPDIFTVMLMYNVTENRVPSVFLWVLRFQGPIESETKKEKKIGKTCHTSYNHFCCANHFFFFLGKIVKGKERLFCSYFCPATLLGKICQPMHFRFDFIVDLSSLPNGL